MAHRLWKLLAQAGHRSAFRATTHRDLLKNRRCGNLDDAPRSPLPHQVQTMMDTRPSVFISSDPRDSQWRDLVLVHLNVHALQGLLDPWDEDRIGFGQDRDAALTAAMDIASVAILIVTANFLGSEFLQTKIVPHLLKRRAQSGLAIVPLLAAPCDWQSPEWLRGLEVRPQRDRYLSQGSQHQIAIDLTDMAREIRVFISGTREGKALPALPRRLVPRFPDEETRTLSNKLELARSRKAELVAVGASTAEVDREILDLRRQLRRGGQLKAGDSLEDGRYLLLNRLGKGGFAVVWEALDRSTLERVAIKVLHPELAGDAIRRERLFRGAREMAQLRHPGVVRVLKPYGEDDGYYYFVMELVAGGDLRQAVLGGRVRSDNVIEIICRIGDALAEAHAHGIVHRDIKPANVLVDTSGQVKLTDFDLVAGAHTTGGTRTGALGTFLYAAPELLHRPQDADARSDVYGLGMTAIFCLHGSELPHWVVRDPNKIIRRLRTSAAVKSVLLRATDWTKEQRFANARELCLALMNCMVSGKQNPQERRHEATPPDAALATADKVLAALPQPSSGVLKGLRLMRFDLEFPALFLIGSSIVVLAVVLVETQLSRLEEPTSASPTPSLAHHVEEPTSASPIPLAVVKGSSISNFEIIIESIPEGATVLENGDVLGSTPLKMSLENGMVRGNPLRLTVQKEGFEPYSIIQGPSEHPVHIVVPLTAVAGRPRPSSSSPSVTTSGGGSRPPASTTSAPVKSAPPPPSPPSSN
ncbi:protein kinase domain-containing protein [Sorangium sp. So ce145]|uniref:serine/threonine-protein kinase n=1 Tax=Sorangium sp. So ce145 TaxID=3133285 RepID=UPI003F61BE52